MAAETDSSITDHTIHRINLFCVLKNLIWIPYIGKEIKRRKRHRRKQYEDQEPCTIRGVYYKNMKWQAAIKVDKKQIHLGTVGSQDEAACLLRIGRNLNHSFFLFLKIDG
jgi:hypothetical protein